MPYIGNPIYQSAFVVDQFSGNGSTTAFTMSVAPAGVTNVLVAVSGVLQDPSTYSVVGNTLTFTAAPPSGTGNISCRYLGVPASGVTTTAYRTVTEFTATASQTTFTPPSYTVGFINVYLNGVLLGSADYTASNGTTVVLATGASAGNLVTVESFLVSSVLNAIPNTAGAVTSSNIQSGVTINFADGSASTPSITNDGDTNTGMFFPAADTIAFTEGGVESMRIDSSGNVGIGETSPAGSAGYTQLVVRGSSGAELSLKGGTTQYGYVYVDNGGFRIINPQSGSSSGTLQFSTSNTERMRITSIGDFLVGKTTAGATTNGFEVKPNDGGTNIPIVGITGNTTNAGATALQLYSTSNSTFRFYVNYNGTIYAQSTTISGISDQRFKENIVDLNDGLNAIMALKPRKFDWKEGKGKDIKGDRGFIAQEFETVFPDLVDEWKDPAPEGEEPYKSVRADLIPVLVKAIQELNAKVEAQAAEIAALKGATE